MAYYNGKQILLSKTTLVNAIIETELSPTSANAIANSAVVKNFSNVLKGKVSGEIIRVDDVSPIEHIAKIKLSGDVDPSTVTVTKCGRNMWYGQASLSATNYGAVTSISPFYSKGTYTLSAVVESTDTDTDLSVIEVYAKDTSVQYLYFTRNERCARTFTVNGPITILLYRAGEKSATSEGDTVSFKDIQLELGETATEYEQYTPETYTPNADGTFELALSSTISLMTAIEGVTLDFEYNRDINKPIAGIDNKADIEKWELIDTITTTEDITGFTLTKEPDGTQYNFRKLRLIINTTSGSTGYAYLSLNPGFLYFYPAKERILIEEKIEHGYIFANSYSATGGTAPDHVTGTPTLKQTINKLQIGGGTFKTGSTFEIWGVRA